LSLRSHRVRSEYVIGLSLEADLDVAAALRMA
jgi:hypothetical protein